MGLQRGDSFLNETKIVFMQKVKVFLFLFTLMGIAIGVDAQTEEKTSVGFRVGADIKATIVCYNEVQRDYQCFGARVRIEVPGNIIEYLNGNSINASDLLLDFSIPSFFNGSQDITMIKAQFDNPYQPNFIDLAKTGLSNIIRDWLIKSDVVTLIKENNLHAFTVGGQINVDNRFSRGNFTSAQFEITMHYN